MVSFKVIPEDSKYQCSHPTTVCMNKAPPTRPDARTDWIVLKVLQVGERRLPRSDFPDTG